MVLTMRYGSWLLMMIIWDGTMVRLGVSWDVVYRYSPK